MHPQTRRSGFARRNLTRCADVGPRPTENSDARWAPGTRPKFARASTAPHPSGTIAPAFRCYFDQRPCHTWAEAMRDREGNVTTEPLTFKVAPHIVEDLGLNLYTSLPRSLVEFVANAYDADSPCANITLDLEAIKRARLVLKKEYEIELTKADGTPRAVPPLASRTLPVDQKIVIEDAGIGMSREDLDEKFLFAGRRRRQAEPEAKGRTPIGRPLMGRKGLGKLAGFGVAKLIQVETRKQGETHATRITLDYDELATKRTVHEIEVRDERLEDGGGFATSGTRVILSRLLYDPLKSRSQTIEHEIAEHFALIDPGDFAITMNTSPVVPAPRTHAFAWPDPDTIPVDDLVEHRLEREGGAEIAFQYRIRFTGEREALPASQRGIRVYANKRLAAVPSLLRMDTNMHGFRMTDYMDAVVHADFIELEDADYTATDRQSLRWDTPLLAPLYDFLSDSMKEACKRCQKKRDDEAPRIVKQDAFTVAEIDKHAFSRRDRRLALRMAVALKAGCKRGVEDPDYQQRLPALVQGLGHGMILTAITSLAAEHRPELSRVAFEIARLTKDELDHFVSTVKARLKAIEAFRKIVQDVNFKNKKEEKIVQKMFEKSPWMIDPTYTQFLSANQANDTLFIRLAKELGIADFAPEGSEHDEERPDLVFFIGNNSLNRLVIVELKAPNLSLEAEHLTQLDTYIEKAETWLLQHDRAAVRVHGHLLGSLAPSASRAKGVLGLRQRIKKAGPDCPWRVRDFLDVLAEVEAAHNELLEIHRRAEREAENDGA